MYSLSTAMATNMNVNPALSVPTNPVTVAYVPTQPTVNVPLVNQVVSQPQQIDIRFVSFADSPYRSTATSVK